MEVSANEIVFYGDEKEPAAPSLSSVPARDLLIEVNGHLHAAIVQSIPTDDQIIMNHVRAAYALVGLLLKAAK